MAQPPDPLALAGDLVTYAARVLRASRQNIHETPAAGMRVLSLIDEHGPSGISALAAYDRTSQPTMSGAVAGLVERAWVEKTVDPTDARASLVHLTDAGRTALAVVRRRNAEAVASAIDAHPTLTTEDLATAVAVLRGVLEGTSPKGTQ
ncbi:MULTISPECIES: MarR family winged helix-turn-helix transcriptional regulator [unclassified Nocardioides]|uniref:MarR family winged helix-turn-helix transcriptional regulator n=1 Tax=unclassified Nocardioides TaxID=2615069 RepID=UPI0006FDAC4E|nr:MULTISPECIES: MarR family winged helix-turn-helix transcriptional regulator [unclassified Nocardioides]KQY63538.1 MarR family transcriptional regulator [Nocardioides sp. Root140]KQZ67439.1 MarR family transcriptional regulator [Nocardioides sp. Root151]KRF17511.1 MarR family transcriptional regulator [Nocardioides sp. Soil796]